MKSLLRSFIINTFSLWLTTEIISGFKIRGNFEILLFAALILTFINIFVRPVIKLLLFPFNLLTLGALSWIVNVLVLFLLTYFVKEIQITTWQFPGFSYQGFVIPGISFGIIETYILSSFVLSLISIFLKWL